MPKVERTCAACGKRFEVWPVRADTAKYCGRECRDGVNAKRYKANRPPKACVICGKEFECPPSHEQRKSCCSLVCARKLDGRRARPVGDENYNWKGGTSVHADGYLLLFARAHPFAANGRYVFEHRLVMEAWMRDKAPDHHFLVEIDGTKYLRPEIEVHHRDEDKRNNRHTNLLACTQPAHRSIHNGQPPMEGEVWPPIQGMAPFEPYHMKRTCMTCGGEFMKKRSDVKRGSGLYCCRACYDARPREAFHAVNL